MSPQMVVNWEALSAWESMMDFIRTQAHTVILFDTASYFQEDKKREAADIIAKNGRPLSQAGDDEPGPKVTTVTAAISPAVQVYELPNVDLFLTYNIMSHEKSHRNLQTVRYCNW